MNPKNLAMSLAFLKSRVDDLPGVREDLTRRLTSHRQELKNMQQRLGIIDMSREFYKQAIDLIYETSVGEIEKVLNASLKYIFYDKQYEIKLDLDVKRGAKQLEIVIHDLSTTPPSELSIQDGVGFGIRTIVSFVIHTYYLINKGAYPIIFVDEKYSFISEGYVERFFSFVKSLAKEKGLALVMITQDGRFTVYADKVISVVDGRVKETKAKSND